jgi:CheY-like chemotaxis protein
MPLGSGGNEGAHVGDRGIVTEYFGKCVDERAFAVSASAVGENKRMFGGEPSATIADVALKELLLDDFACILLDVQMPELDGFQLATLIKERRRSRHIPIIFVTALSKDETHVYRGYSAGAVDYIFKPIDPDVLR